MLIHSPSFKYIMFSSSECEVVVEVDIFPVWQKLCETKRNYSLWINLKKLDSLERQREGEQVRVTKRERERESILSEVNLKVNLISKSVYLS